MNIRLAETTDIEQLIKMRWDFTLEDDECGKIQDSEYSKYHTECESFLIESLASDEWFIWVVEIEGKIVSHIYTELVQKVPRPGRVTYPFAFMTNVYTVPGYRGTGIGSKLLSTINKWAKEQKYEFIIVWPSDQSVDYYSRNEFEHCKGAMMNMIN
ncbi:GNAT family N-acetyltransferase [Cytobacillus sp. IB215316]|uniref:GNAT family N-acetyltransferase n=1 Tax=Cytobacillus sp. IB215316 TaxID=3097354 RepID=UPI002A126D45|nr:GNAT family N-acetyltransferase [Cytobacillus sp. IB215316]MDX8361582.1 GNAT family N-acetyltransferase [Cytobacillus sp. IB215316]